jgi:hypothetical protein
MIKKYISGKKKSFHDILQNANILWKWFKWFQNLMKYLVIYWIRIDCTISITIEMFDSCDFSKKSKQIFHSNERKCVEKTHLVKRLLSFERWQELLQAFVSKSIFYVYQNARWNQRKIAPKLYPKKIHFLA